MKEYLTEAIVLGVRPVGEQDNLVDFYSRHLGRLQARVISGRKILSKLSCHLDPLNLVSVRLVEKKQFIVADVATLDRFSPLRFYRNKLTAALVLISALRNLSFPSDPDPRLWHWFTNSLKRGKFNIRDFLRIIGYDSAAAVCGICGVKNVNVFSLDDHFFVCRRCGFKIPFNRLLLIK